MKTLLEYREKMKLFLGKYDIYIFPVLKFALALIVFLSINGNVGFMSRRFRWRRSRLPSSCSC